MVLTLGSTSQIGTLAPGAWGDAVIFELHEGQFHLMDSDGGVRIGREKLVPVTVVKSGRVLPSTLS